MKLIVLNSYTHSSIIFLIYTLFNLLDFSIQDLPIHCLKSQIVGKWKIQSTELFTVNNGHEMKCGHQEPSTEATSWRAKTNLPFINDFELELKDNDKIYYEGNLEGEWTMIYDEGFNMEFEDLSFFAFNKYTISRNKTTSDLVTFKSKCYQTLLGWYHNKNRTRWGCYRGEKLGVDVNETLFQKEKNKTIEEIAFVDPVHRKSNRKNKVTERIRFLSPPTFLKMDLENHFTKQLNFHKQYFEKLQLVKKNWKAEFYHQFMNMTLKELNQFMGIKRNKEDDKENNYKIGNEFRFKEVDKKRSKQNKEEEEKEHGDHEHGNEHEHLYQTEAKEEKSHYEEKDEQENKDKKELKDEPKDLKEEKEDEKENKEDKDDEKEKKEEKEESKQNKDKSTDDKEESKENKEKSKDDKEESKENKEDKNNFSKDQSEKENKNNEFEKEYNSHHHSEHPNSENSDNLQNNLPDNFDWLSVIKPTESQKGCGSCYAWATMRMLEARIKIQYDQEVKLSVQHALDCSYYNQACKGGFPYLVLKFSKDFELVPEDCHPYEAETGKCSDSCDLNKLDFNYTVENYSYLGGAYGRANETIMMEELFLNGPFVVSIEPDYGFVYYKSGIYSGIKNETYFQMGLPIPEWRKVDHSVLLVGWGVDDITHEKYWLIQNSWGSNWGEDGFFKIIRGTDELNVESMLEIGTPGLKKGKNIPLKRKNNKLKRLK